MRLMSVRVPSKFLTAAYIITVVESIVYGMGLFVCLLFCLMTCSSTGDSTLRGLDGLYIAVAFLGMVFFSVLLATYIQRCNEKGEAPSLTVAILCFVKVSPVVGILLMMEISVIESYRRKVPEAPSKASPAKAFGICETCKKVIYYPSDYKRVRVRKVSPDGKPLGEEIHVYCGSCYKKRTKK